MRWLYAVCGAIDGSVAADICQELADLSRSVRETVQERGNESLAALQLESDTAAR